MNSADQASDQAAMPSFHSRRRRSFLAQRRDEPLQEAKTPTQERPTPSAALPAADDEDFPVLTEIVEAEENVDEDAPQETDAAEFRSAARVFVATPEANQPANSEFEPLLIADSVFGDEEARTTLAVDTEAMMEEKLGQLADDLRAAITRQMQHELPMLIEAALLEVGDELRSGIAEITEHALREFLDGRKSD